MEDLLQDFLTETHDHLETVDRQLVEFERVPSNNEILRSIFRLVHTIKGTCGFIGLPRLEALTHAAETVLGQLRDGALPTPDCVGVVLATIDRIKHILGALGGDGREPAGDDNDLIRALEDLARRTSANVATGPETDVVDPLDLLERAFRDAPGPDDEPEAPQTSDPHHRPVPLETSGSDGAPEGDAMGTRTVALATTYPNEDRDTRGSGPVGATDGAPARTAPVTPGPSDEDSSGQIRITQQSIRVNVATLEHLMTMVSELVLSRNQLLEIARRAESEAFKQPLQRLSHITAELQDGVMKTRMQPIGVAWGKLPRLIRDLGAELGKKLDLIMEGADTELDRQVLEQIKDPLTHMVRNSADHGIETPAERKAAGKPETGTVRLTAAHEGGSITIRISDDGKGLDIARIRHKAREIGLASAAELEAMNDAQVARFVFHPGFSTASRVTNISGRGVGMDVVRSNIDAIGGTVDIQSEPGKGTCFTVKIPLTLAIISALIVTAEAQRFAIPQVAVRELVRVQAGSEHVIETVNGAAVLRLRDSLLPITCLGETLRIAEHRRDDGFVVVTQVGKKLFGLLVDSVSHTEEIVVKPMSSKLKSLSVFSGNTILGDGAVVLIIDPNGLARISGSLAGDERSVPTAAMIAHETARERQTILVFRAGGAGTRAVPLSLVTRLEEIDAATIERGSGRWLVQYRGRLMPIVPADANGEPASDGRQPLIIFSEGERVMGLAVSSIVDIVDEALEIEVGTDTPGVVGSAVIGGRATELIDLAHYLPQAYPDWLQATRRPVTDVSASGIMLVEPSAFIRDMLVPVLRSSGHAVTLARDLQQARTMLEGRAPPAALLIDLDTWRGSDLGDWLGALGPAVLIGLSTLPQASVMETAHALGIRDVIAKFDRPALMRAIATHTLLLPQAA